MPNTKSSTGCAARSFTRTAIGSPEWNTNDGCPPASRKATSVISTSREPQRPSVAWNMFDVGSAGSAAAVSCSSCLSWPSCPRDALSTALAVVAASSASSPSSTFVR